MKKNRSSDTWNSFWKKVPSAILEDKQDSWYSLVWKVGREYWADIFDRNSKGKKMLECGAGSAKISLYMARLGYNCTMLDNSKEGLKTGQYRFKEEKLPGKFILDDVTKMKFKKGSFDVVFSGGLLHHLHDLQPALNEMARVLKKGGLCAAVVIPDKFSCQTIGNAEAYMVRFVKKLIKGKWKGIIKNSKNDFPFYVNSYSLKEYKKAFDSAGFINVYGTGLSPFPSFALPQKGQKLYAHLLKLLMPLWKWFDKKNFKFTEIWGASYGIYGFKK